MHKNTNLNQVRHFIDIGFPVIVNYIEPFSNTGHYAIIKGYTKKKIIKNDPFLGNNFMINNKEFESRWVEETGSKTKKWIIVLSKKPFDIGRQYNPNKR